MMIKYILLISGLFFLISCANHDVLTTDELKSILGIQTWRVPIPQDKSLQWGIKIIDNNDNQIEYSEANLNYDGSALVALRSLGDEIYEFTLEQNNGTGRGKLELNVKNYKITWFKEPKFLKDNLYPIAEIYDNWPFNKKVSKLIVLRLLNNIKIK